MTKTNIFCLSHPLICEQSSLNYKTLFLTFLYYFYIFFHLINFLLHLINLFLHFLKVAIIKNSKLLLNISSVKVVSLNVNFVIVITLNFYFNLLHKHAEPPNVIISDVPKPFMYFIQITLFSSQTISILEKPEQNIKIAPYIKCTTPIIKNGR